MLNLTCARAECGQAFEVEYWRLYCPACVEFYKERKREIHRAKKPSPGIHLDYSIAQADDCPKSGVEPITGVQCCGLCGSSDVTSGYGIGTGYGAFGSYTFCHGCNSFLDFVSAVDEDEDEAATAAHEADLKRLEAERAENANAAIRGIMRGEADPIDE